MADILIRNAPATSVYLREHVKHAVNAAVSFATQHAGKPPTGIRRGVIMRSRVGDTEHIVYIYATTSGNLIARFVEEPDHG